MTPPSIPSSHEPQPQDGLWVSLPQALVEAVAQVHDEGETLESFVNDVLRKEVRRRQIVGPLQASIGAASGG